MQLSELIEDVLSLQPRYTSANSDSMRKRGVLIRRSIPEVLVKLAPVLAAATNVPQADLIVEGRDGTGLKSEVPWVRFASRSASPKATAGWYVVWLHKRDGSGAYLSLAHGSTTFIDGALVARPDSELQRLMSWSREMLKVELSRNPRLQETIHLASEAPLSLAYEKSCVTSYFYEAGSIPDDSVLTEDMLTLARYLSRLYGAEQLGIAPFSPNPEVRDSISSVAAIARPNMAGQGFSLSAQERRAVELQAMAKATLHLQALGFSVKDVSHSHSYDLEATRGETRLKIEVKGTTGCLDSILLTRNEVLLHESTHPNNGLIVVHSIDLTRGEVPIAAGGELEYWQPWRLDNSRLVALSYVYRLA